MMRFSTKRLAVSVLLAVLAFTLSGCWNPFAPDEGDPVPIPPAEYRDRLTAEDVLHNIKTAYIYRNVDEYLDCLSEDFIFYPDERDVQNPELEIPPEWYKVDEGFMHQNMFSENSDVESIDLTLTVSSLVPDYGIPEDPLDDTVVCVVDVDLRVRVIGDLTYLATAQSQYNMRIDVDQPNEPPDPNGTLWWEIYLWYDLGDPGRDGGEDGPGVQRVSLGELKSLYME